MKQYGWIIALLVGVALGAVAGWSVAMKRVQNDVVFFLDGKSKSDIAGQEIEAARAYLMKSPEEAYNELNRLLFLYGFYAGWPEQHPGERAERSSFATAMAHGRLANVCARLGRLEDSQTHLDEALKHKTIGDEKKLEEMLNHLDRAEQKQWNFKKEENTTL